jgi:hypothetical protein
LLGVHRVFRLGVVAARRRRRFDLIPSPASSPASTLGGGGGGADSRRNRSASAERIDSNASFAVDSSPTVGSRQYCATSARAVCT